MDINIMTASTPAELIGMLSEKDGKIWRIQGGVSVCVDAKGNYTYAILLVSQKNA
ncbi:MAG: hypothetical protein ACLGJB_09590 [Blastocatellia bacterium]|jgi:hypothetical protein